MSLPSIPALSPELVDALDTRFPERCPDPGWADRDVWRKVGQREVVRFLLAELAKQQDTDIKGDTIENVRIRRK